MKGFALRTGVRAHLCVKCGLYFDKARAGSHKCESNSPFQRLLPGTDEYCLWVELFSRWDTGTWNAGLTIQAASISGYRGAYILVKDFFRHYHASLVAEESYARLKPGQMVRIMCEDQHSGVYVNPDCSAVLLRPNVLEQLFCDI